MRIEIDVPSVLVRTLRSVAGRLAMLVSTAILIGLPLTEPMADAPFWPYVATYYVALLAWLYVLGVLATAVTTGQPAATVRDESEARKPSLARRMLASRITLLLLLMAIVPFAVLPHLDLIQGPWGQALFAVLGATWFAVCQRAHQSWRAEIDPS